jgi:hypothetical protein
VKVSAEGTVSVPARLRPRPEQVCRWYEQTLLAMGAEVERVGPTQLEFSVPFSQAFFDLNPATSLAPLSRGELDVIDTADGFEVSVRGTSRWWVSYLPIAVFGVATGGLAFITTPLRFLPAVAGLVLLAAAWARTRAAVSRFVETTNAEIADSYAALPPGPEATGPDATITSNGHP